MHQSFELMGKVVGWVGGVFVLCVSLWLIVQILKGLNRSFGFEESSVGSRVVLAVYVVVLIVMLLARNGN